MGPATTTVRTISQEAFDDLVKENIDDLEMEPAEAVQDAIQTLTLQGVDLSGHFTTLFSSLIIDSVSDSNFHFKTTSFHRYREECSGREQPCNRVRRKVEAVGI